MTRTIPETAALQLAALLARREAAQARAQLAQHQAAALDADLARLLVAHGVDPRTQGVVTEAQPGAPVGAVFDVATRQLVMLPDADPAPAAEPQ